MLALKSKSGLLFVMPKAAKIGCGWIISKCNKLDK